MLSTRRINLSDQMGYPAQPAQYALVMMPPPSQHLSYMPPMPPYNMEEQESFPMTRQPERPAKRKPPKNMFHQALQSLASTLQELSSDSPNLTLLLSGLGVYREVRRLANSQQNTIPEQKLIDILNSTRILMMGCEEHPMGNAGYRKEIDTFHDLANEMNHFPWGRVLTGLMFSLLGALIIVVSGIIALVSLGLLAPIQIAGASLGISLLTGGVATAIGLTAGMGSMLGGNLLFFKAAQKSVLRQEMGATETAARHVGQA